jgi:glucosamine kinase
MDRSPLVRIPRALGEPLASAHGRYVMGIDGGATKTTAAVLDLDGGAVSFAHGGPSNQDAIGAKAAVEALLQVADLAISRAGISERDLARVVLAVAGTDTGTVARHVREARSEDWIVVNDVVAAWATATGARPGVGAISGTGSNVFGVGPEDRPWRAGGWGHILGDEGSGYWLGIESIKAALHDRDGTGPQTGLSDAVSEFFGADEVEQVAARVYSEPLTKREIAAFAPQVAKLATAGDAVARGLYERGAAELGHQIAVVIAKTGLGEDGSGFPVGLIGGVYKVGSVFVDPLTTVIHETAPLARVSVVEMAPVGGSLLLAARACRRGLDPAALARLLDASLAAAG